MTKQTSSVLLNYQEAGVSEIVLNRPDKRNAFDDVIIQQLIKALEVTERDDQTRIVILRSEGKHFSAGADLGWMRRMADNDHAENLNDSRELARLMSTLNHLSKPVIGAVDGWALGYTDGTSSIRKSSNQKPLTGQREFYENRHWSPGQHPRSVPRCSPRVGPPGRLGAFFLRERDRPDGLPQLGPTHCSSGSGGSDPKSAPYDDPSHRTGSGCRFTCQAGREHRCPN